MLRLPPSQRQPGTDILILQVLGQHAAGLGRGLFICHVIFVEELCVVGVSGLVVGQDGAVIRVCVLQLILFGLYVTTR